MWPSSGCGYSCFLCLSLICFVRGVPRHFVSVWPCGFIYKAGRKPVSSNWRGVSEPPQKSDFTGGRSRLPRIWAVCFLTAAYKKESQGENPSRLAASAQYGRPLASPPPPIPYVLPPPPAPLHRHHFPLPFPSHRLLLSYHGTIVRNCWLTAVAAKPVLRATVLPMPSS
jgi:hypothetical protein